MVRKECLINYRFFKSRHWHIIHRLMSSCRLVAVIEFVLFPMPVIDDARCNDDLVSIALCVVTSVPHEGEVHGRVQEALY